MKLLAAFLMALLLAASPAAARGPRPATPTPAQVRAAVSRAEHSRRLWATINICNTAAHPNTVGIRGQMPALGFAARLRMVFGIDLWGPTGGGFKALKGVAQPSEDGGQRGGTWQTGVLLRFPPHTGLVRGRVRFEWRMGSRTIGHLDEVTHPGHTDARYSDPSGFSSGRCRLP